MNKKEIEKVKALHELFTLRDWLRWSLSQFYQADLYFGHGTDNAWDEALYILLSALNLPPDINPAVLDARLLDHEKKQIAELIERRVVERLPAAYLTQKAWFAGLPFYIDERVVIPRSPFAELIENQFSPWIATDQVGRIIDLCTGSGCIGMACAVNFPDAKVDVVDISADALAVAAINLQRHQLQNQVRLIQSDLFHAVPDQIYDVIVSNPPYVSKAEYADLPAEYHREPKLGLEAGDDGLDVVVRILHAAPKHLSPQGILIVEVGNSETALIERFPEVPFTWLELERGGSGIFLLTFEQLEKYHQRFLLSQEHLC